MRRVPAFMLCVSAALVGFDAPAFGQNGPALVRVGKVETRAVRPHRAVVGQLEPARRSTVAAEEPGRVTVAPPLPGTSVRAGQRLAAVDDQLLKQEHAALTAGVAIAEAQVAEQKALLAATVRDRDQIKQLLASNVAKQKEMDDAEGDVTAARARTHLAEAAVLRAQAELAHLQKRLERATTEAPFDGVVVRKLTEMGQWLAAGDPVVEMVDIAQVKARLEVPPTMIAHLNTGDPVTLKIGALDTERTDKLFRIVPDADQRSRTFDVLVRLDNPDGALKPGMTVTAHLPAGPQRMKALTVPRDAIVSTLSGTLVYAVRDGRAAAVPVVVRFGLDDRVVVDAPLEDGESVVTEGNERLQPGTALSIQTASPPSAD